MSHTMTKTRTSTDTIISEPTKYKVVIYNDDVTPMDFVIALLVSIFKHNEGTAIALTNEVHKAGSAVAGVYTYEIAEHKGIEGIQHARKYDFPLVLKVEAE